MEAAFGYVLFAVVVIAAVVAIASLRGERYDHIGRGGLFEDDPKRRASDATSTVVRDEEVRQMVEAANVRRMARGEAPRDVEAEMARLTKPSVDPALEAEVRDLVTARNARRVRRGQPPLDVEAEVRRQLDDAMG
ncbi:MAG TPA: hypothetical protein VN238_08810 [Solirubrobacteraceae bacterium]|nr:hypothetical protein [Solirubrobacteraceae bacterium]